jgi:N6-L-threonylcarbamoyladenine synthase
MEEAGLDFKNLSHIAVANSPGLIGALLVGVSTAKALAYGAKKPLIAVNHIEGHVYANFLQHKDELEFPLICLIVSGGHTMVVKMTGHGEYEVMGNTRDDAVGEAFDKVARTLGIGYPGGPVIDKLSKKEMKTALNFLKQHWKKVPSILATAV